MLVTKANFDRIIKELWAEPKRYNVDTETNGLKRHKGDHMVGVSIRRPSLKTPAYYFPFRHTSGNLPASHLSVLIDVLNRPTHRYTGWNFGFDIGMLSEEGMQIPRYAEDIMVAAHLCNENEPKGGGYRLKVWSEKYTDPNARHAEFELLKKLMAHGYGKDEMWKLPPADVDEYASDDVNLTEKGRRYALSALKSWGILHLFDEVAMKYMLANYRMESRGIQLNVDLIKEYIEEAERELGPALEKLEEIAGYPINPNSNPQIQALLGVKSAAKEVLDAMPPSPTIDALLAYRGWKKVVSSYYEPYLQFMDSDGVLYPNIWLTGTVAGRPSCSEPNLQALPKPRKTIKAYKVKDCLVAREGYTLVIADYSQAELRYGAHVTQDKNLIEAFANNLDIHQFTADYIQESRDKAKTTNFSVMYGIGAPGLAKRLRIPVAEADAFLKKYHSQVFPRIKPKYASLQRLAKRQGYIRLWTKRVRRYFSQMYPEHQKALSNKVQGGVAEIMRHAITRLDAEMFPHPNWGTGSLVGCHMLLQVHDSIAFEVPTKILKKALPIIKFIMEDFPFRVKLKVDIGYGQVWSNMTSVQPDDLPPKTIEALRKWNKDPEIFSPLSVPSTEAKAKE